MKSWENAELCELEISDTMYGGVNFDNPDGYYEDGKDGYDFPVTTFGS